MAIAISVLTLLALIYQLYLQRVHNENSLKPLGQINLIDSKEEISILLTNAGMGPLIIDSQIFVKEGKVYANIAECLSINQRSYMHTIVDDVVKKVLLPNAEMKIFSKNITTATTEETDAIRRELTEIRVKVAYRDIYKNKFSIERSLQWFSRHLDQFIGGVGGPKS